MAETAKKKIEHSVREKTDLREETRFKGGGGRGEILRMLPSVYIPPIIAVPLSPIMLAWWCWAYDLPYWDIVTDIGQNSLYFISVVIGIVLLTSAFVLVPGFFRIWEDYTIHPNGEADRSAKSEEVRELRWNVAFILASMIFSMLYIYFIGREIFIYFLDNNDLNWQNILLFLINIFGCASQMGLIYQQAKQHFKMTWNDCKLKEGGQRWAAMQLMAARINGRDLPDVTASASARKVLLLVRAEDGGDPAGLESEAQSRPRRQDLWGVGMMMGMDLMCLSFFLVVHSGMVERVASSGDSPDKLMLVFVLLLFGPVFPILCLMAAKSWADNRSPFAGAATVLVAMGLLAVVYPGIPQFIHKAAGPLNFGGDRPVVLFLSPAAACTHQNLFKTPPDCTSAGPGGIRTDVVQLSWMGPGKVIIRPGKGNKIVLDRKDVRSYEIISRPGTDRDVPPQSAVNPP